MSLEKLMRLVTAQEFGKAQVLHALWKRCVCVVAWFTNSLGLSLKT